MVPIIWIIFVMLPWLLVHITTSNIKCKFQKFFCLIQLCCVWRYWESKVTLSNHVLLSGTNYSFCSSKFCAHRKRSNIQSLSLSLKMFSLTLTFIDVIVVWFFGRCQVLIFKIKLSAWVPFKHQTIELSLWFWIGVIKKKQ